MKKKHKKWHLWKDSQKIKHILVTNNISIYFNFRIVYILYEEKLRVVLNFLFIIFFKMHTFLNYKDIHMFQVKRNDILTFQLCKDCYLNIKLSCKFKKLCRNSDKKFRTYLILKEAGEMIDFNTFLKSNDDSLTFR